MEILVEEMPKEVQDLVSDGWDLGVVTNSSIVLKKGRSRKLWDVARETIVCSWSSKWF
jgi:hypothetical protein